MLSPKINVIFRACDKVNAVNKQPRPFNLEKSELIKACFKSLYASLQYVPHTLTVLGDKLSADMMDFFSGYDVQLSNGDYGNDASIRQSMQTALTFLNDDEWIYFCEDDYLHREETFLYITNLINDKKNICPGKRRLGLLSSIIHFNKPNLVIFPSDYPDRYCTKNRRQHFIFYTQDCHWRQVTNTTFTFLIQVKDVKKYSRVLLKASENANDAWLSRMIFGSQYFVGKLLCVSPIPALTAHMHINTLPPLVNWESIVDKFSATGKS
jgi:hypothetical protein